MTVRALLGAGVAAVLMAAAAADAQQWPTR
jgi:opacity protein-like surface antigen